MPNIRDNHHESLVWFILGNTLLLVLVLTGVIFQVLQNRNEIIQKTKIQAANTAAITEEAILESFKALDIVTDQIVYEAKKGATLEQLTEEDRTHYLHNMGLVKGILLTWTDEHGNPMGGEFNLNDSSGRRFNYSDRDYFNYLKNAPAGSKIITEPIMGKSTRHWLSITAKRLSDKKGKFKGIVIVAVTQEFFEGIKNKINIEGKNSFTVAVGNSPHYFYRFPDRPEIIGRPLIPNPDATEVVRKKLHRAVFETTSPVDGTQRISAHSWIGQEPLMIVIGLDLATALNPWVRQSILTFSISIIGMVLFIFLIFYFLKNNNEIRKYQAQLASSVKMAALGEMAGGMAHEINNPLAIIEQNASFLNELLDEDFDKATAKKITQTIVQTTERIAKIIKGLRAFSRNADNDPFNVVTTGQLIEETIGICREKFKVHNVSLTVDNPCPFLKLECRQVQISQVLLNLFNNSYDAVEKDFEKWVRVEVKDQINFVEISVVDSGKGISKEVQEKLFQPFFTTKEIGKGTGLGLSISKGIIESHRGTFSIDTASGNTRFVITLPKKQTNEVSVEKVA